MSVGSRALARRSVPSQSPSARRAKQTPYDQRHCCSRPIRRRVCGFRGVCRSPVAPRITVDRPRCRSEGRGVTTVRRDRNEHQHGVQSDGVLRNANELVANQPPAWAIENHAAVSVSRMPFSIAPPSPGCGRGVVSRRSRTRRALSCAPLVDGVTLPTQNVASSARARPTLCPRRRRTFGPPTALYSRVLAAVDRRSARWAQVPNSCRGAQRQ
jgi:hypothetical protein